MLEMLLKYNQDQFLNQSGLIRLVICRCMQLLLLLLDQEMLLLKLGYDQSGKLQIMLTQSVAASQPIYKGNWLTDSSLFIQSQSLFSIKYDSSNSYIYANSILKTSGNAGNLPINGTLIIGGEGFSTAFEGRIQELIYYFSDQSSNRTYIENNINSYYGIYTPDSVSTEDAFVKTWYDQSGNGYHATQSVDANQPQIVSSGVIVTENGKPAIYGGVNTPLIASTPGIAQPYTIIAAVKGNDVGGQRFISDGQSLNVSQFAIQNSNQIGIYAGTGVYHDTTVNLTSSFVGYAYFSSSNSEVSINIEPTTTGSVGSGNLGNAITLFNNGGGGSRGLRGYMQEWLLYTTNQSASRNLITDNINGYYNIFTHSLDSGSGYVTRWYDQSGNDRHATQSVTTDQPLILSSGSIITLNNKPALSFDGDNDFLSIASLTNTNSNSVFQVLKTEPHEGTGAEFPFSFNGDRVYYAQSPVNTFIMASNVGYTISGMDTLNLVLNSMFYSSNGSIYQNGILKGSSLSFNPSVGTFTGFIGNVLINRPDLSSRMITHELLYYTSSQISTRAPIEQNINTYFNIYTPLGYNLNTNSLSLFSSPTTVAGAANNVASASFTTGGPLGLITVSRTGSSNYTLWKNRVPNKVTLSPSVPQSTELYLNAANLNNSLFSASQNNIAYASVGAGLTDDEVYTYYELVDELYKQN
jgi:hypothetical protein